MFDKNQVTFDGITYEVPSIIMSSVVSWVKANGIQVAKHYKTGDGEGAQVRVDSDGKAKLVRGRRYEEGLEAVFDMICEERDYQDACIEKMNHTGGNFDDSHWSPGDWLEMIWNYLDDGTATIFNSFSKKQSDLFKMCCIRKIAALAVAAMENCDTPSRSREEKMPRR